MPTTVAIIVLWIAGQFLCNRKHSVITHDGLLALVALAFTVTTAGLVVVHHLF